MFAVVVVLLNALSFASLAYVANRKGQHTMAALLAARACRRNSITAMMARKLLESLQKELEQHTADRDRLRRWLERRQSAAQVA
jgi:hypothetical protein